MAAFSLALESACSYKVSLPQHLCTLLAKYALKAQAKTHQTPGSWTSLHQTTRKIVGRADAVAEILLQLPLAPLHACLHIGFVHMEHHYILSLNGTTAQFCLNDNGLAMPFLIRMELKCLRACCKQQ